VLRIAGAERIQVIARPDEGLLLDFIGSSGVAAPSD
jgi:hypothetical protein